MRGALLASILLAGCAASPSEDAPLEKGDDWLVYGIFSRGYTSEDVRAVCAAAESEECVMMESDPPQFGFGYATVADCRRASARMDAVPHTIVRECAPEWEATPYGVAQWRFSGSFTTERTQDDVRAVCQAGGRSDTCAMTKSIPEQYGFVFRAQELCADARAKVLAVPRTADVSACTSVGGDFPPEATP